MRVILVDYIGFYYSGVAKTPVPGHIRGKFVQIREGVTEYLILSPAEFTLYHADIVEHFCREKGIGGTYDKGTKRFDIHDPAWVIAGGGKFEIDRLRHYVHFYDDSMAYGKFDVKGLKERVGHIEEWADYEIRSE